jgi:hypothetical protein
MTAETRPSRPHARPSAWGARIVCVRNTGVHGKIILVMQYYNGIPTVQPHGNPRVFVTKTPGYVVRIRNSNVNNDKHAG